MTVLVGKTGLLGSNSTDTSPQSSGNDAIWRDSGHVAVATGTAALAYLYVPSWSTATGAKVCVYSAGSLLGVSSTFAPADGTGLLSKAITLSGNITSAQTYKIVVTTTGGFIDLRVDLDDAFPGNGIARAVAANFSYASPPATLPSGGSITTGGYWDWIMYIDDGGGAPTLMGAQCL